MGLCHQCRQIEGARSRTGAQPPSGTPLRQKPGKTFGGETPTVACDSYHKFDRDLRNMKALGLNAYRMSISWSRVLPDGTGQLNQKGMDYYRRCFEQLNEAGITPAVTLYHWDLPQVLEDKGGWVNRDSIEWFGEYAEKMFRAFGDVVPMWATINEPIATYVGYALGAFCTGTHQRGVGQPGKTQYSGSAWQGR